jgi:hypothetical protein
MLAPPGEIVSGCNETAVPVGSLKSTEKIFDELKRSEQGSVDRKKLGEVSV